MLVHREKLMDLDLEPRREIPNATLRLSILSNKEKLENSKTLLCLKQRFRQLKLKHPKHPRTTKAFSCSETLHPTQALHSHPRRHTCSCSFDPNMQLQIPSQAVGSHCIECLARVMTLNFRMMPVPNAHNAAFPVFIEISAQRSVWGYSRFQQGYEFCTKSMRRKHRGCLCKELPKKVNYEGKPATGEVLLG